MPPIRRTIDQQCTESGSSEKETQRNLKGTSSCPTCADSFHGKAKKWKENHVKKCKKLHPYVMGQDFTRCSLCDHEASTQGLLFVHLERAHISELNTREQQSKTLMCQLCDNRVLKSHIYFHKKACEKYKGIIHGLKCLVCDKEFSCRNSLLRHANTHTLMKVQVKSKDKPVEVVKCDDCNGIFSSEEEYQKHETGCTITPPIHEESESLVEAKTETNSSVPSSMMTTPSSKNCTYCRQMVLRKIYPKHLEGCSKAANYINGKMCTKCDPRRTFNTRTEAFLHIRQTHPEILDENTIDLDSTLDETMDQDDDDEEIEEFDQINDLIIMEEEKRLKNQDRRIQARPRYQCQPVVQRVFQVNSINDYFPVDPNIITKLIICPFCDGKLANEEKAKIHVERYHNISLDNMNKLGLAFMEMAV